LGFPEYQLVVADGDLVSRAQGITAAAEFLAVEQGPVLAGQVLHAVAPLFECDDGMSAADAPIVNLQMIGGASAYQRERKRALYFIDQRAAAVDLQCRHVVRAETRMA